jgi:hypothetical protein
LFKSIEIKDDFKFFWTKCGIINLRNPSRIRIRIQIRIQNFFEMLDPDPGTYVMNIEPQPATVSFSPSLFFFSLSIFLFLFFCFISSRSLKTNRGKNFNFITLPSLVSLPWFSFSCSLSDKCYFMSRSSLEKILFLNYVLPSHPSCSFRLCSRTSCWPLGSWMSIMIYHWSAPWFLMVFAGNWSRGP